MKVNNRFLVYVVLITFSLLMILPLLFILSTSLKGDHEFVAAQTTLLPQEWRVQNYIDSMKASDWGTFFKNSFIVAIFAVGGSVIVSFLAGFTFARMQFPGRNIIFLLLLMGLMVPAQAVVIPQFIIMKHVPWFGGNDLFGMGGTGWLDTHYALIIPQLAAPVGVFLARQFYQAFPKEMDEAAQIDGAGYFRTFVKIYMPLSGPLIAAFGILKTVYVWNDFFHPLIYTNSASMRTVQLGLQLFNGEADIRFNLLMAATLIVSLPLIVMFFMFQKQFVQSQLSISVKG